MIDSDRCVTSCWFVRKLTFNTKRRQWGSVITLQLRNMPLFLSAGKFACLKNWRTHELKNSRNHKLTNALTRERTNSRTRELTSSRTRTQVVKSSRAHELTNSQTHKLTNSHLAPPLIVLAPSSWSRIGVNWPHILKIKIPCGILCISFRCLIRSLGISSHWDN